MLGKSLGQNHYQNKGLHKMGCYTRWSATWSLMPSAMVSEFTTMLGSNLDREDGGWDWLHCSHALEFCLLKNFAIYLCWWCCTNVPIPISRVSQHGQNVTCCSTWVPFVLIPIPLDSLDKVLVLASYSLVPPLAKIC